MDRIPDLLLSALRVFAAMSPWLVAGFFAAGVLAVWIPRAWVNRALGGRTGLSGVLRAVLVGVPLPICSCGVLPIAAGLRRNGADKGATAAFLAAMTAYNLPRPRRAGAAARTRATMTR